MLLQPAELAGRKATRLIARRAGYRRGQQEANYRPKVWAKNLIYRNAAFAT
jgi:hypothetical protein